MIFIKLETRLFLFSNFEDIFLLQTSKKATMTLLGYGILTLWLVFSLWRNLVKKAICWWFDLDLRKNLDQNSLEIQDLNSRNHEVNLSFSLPKLKVSKMCLKSLIFQQNHSRHTFWGSQWSSARIAREKTKISRNRRTPSGSEKLRSPKGQAFFGHNQVRPTFFLQ